jgi:replication-associated recombination protein RarA
MNHLTSWLGKTARIAETLRRAVPKLQTTRDPLERRYLFVGPPGVGKSTLAEEMAHLLTGDSLASIRGYTSLNVQCLNGQSVSVDVVRQWQDAGRYRSIGNITQVVLIDEIDQMGLPALGQARTWLDRLVPGWVVFATTNKPLTELQDQLQSRFKVYTFEKIQAADISSWLQVEYQLDPVTATKTAIGVDGNMRSAKLDAMALIEAKG